MYMPGATAVGITFQRGVVLASDKRIAYGNFLVSKNIRKTFQITQMWQLHVPGWLQTCSF